MSSFSSTSFNIFLTLSSNSPLYFVPATSAPTSIFIIFLFLSFNGTSLFAIILLNSSTIAVFPTPASPIKIGLFLVLLHSISNSLLISFSLPITGSNSLFFAFSVKFIPSVSTSNFWCFLVFVVNLYENSLYNLSISIFIPINILIATPSPSSKRLVKRCSIVTSPSLFSLLSIIAFSIILFNNGVYKNHSVSIVPTPIMFIISVFSFSYVKSNSFNFLDISLLSFSIASNKCSLPTYGCFNSYISFFALTIIPLASSVKFPNI